MELKTGAFMPVIPPTWAAKKLHDLYPTPEIKILPNSDAFLNEDFYTFLNLMWQVKTFDIEFSATLADPDFGDETQFVPQKTQTITLQDVAIFDKKDGPNETSLLANNPLAPALARVKFVATPYSADRDAARSAIRQEFYKINSSAASKHSRPRITRISNYATYRTAIEADFESFFDDWTTETQNNYDTFSVIDTPRAEICAAEFQRQLEVIPDIKSTYQTKVDQALAQLDAQFAATNNDANGYTASNAILENFKIQTLLKAEKNLELFELARGFEHGLDFFQWHEIKENAAQCLPSLAGFSRNDTDVSNTTLKIACFPSGVFSENGETKMTAFLEPAFGQARGKYTFPYQVQTKYCEEEGTATKAGEKTVFYLGGTSLLGGPPAAAFTPGRTDGYRQAYGEGSAEGGTYGDCDGGALQTVIAYYKDFFDEDGNLKGSLPEFIDFNALNPDAGDVNSVIYSGLFEYNNWQPVIEFFQPLADKIKEINDAESVEVGKFRFADKSGATFIEMPIFANPYVFSAMDVTYKIKTLWQDPVPAP